MGKKKVNEEAERFKKELDEIFPPDLDDFQRKRLAKKQLATKAADDPDKLKDPMALKRRAYELIIQGMSSYSYIPILVREFNVTERVARYYLKGLKDEVKEQYNEVYTILREALIMDIMKMKNEAKTIHEKLKCYELIIKITGLSQENININQTSENRTFVITQVEQKKKEE